MEIIAERDKRSILFLTILSGFMMATDIYFMVVTKSIGLIWFGVLMLAISLFALLRMPKTAITREGSELVIHYFDFYQRRIPLSAIQTVGCNMFNRAHTTFIFVFAIKNDIRSITLTANIENCLKNVSIGGVLHATQVAVRINDLAQKARSFNE